MGELAENITTAIKAGDVYALKNERPDVPTEVEHEFEFHGFCPVTKNPRKGSVLKIAYSPAGSVLDVIGLDAYIKRFRNGLVEDGKVTVRDMEHMIQRVAEDCAGWIGVPVTVTAELVLAPKQRQKIVCQGKP